MAIVWKPVEESAAWQAISGCRVVGAVCPLKSGSWYWDVFAIDRGDDYERGGGYPQSEAEAKAAFEAEWTRRIAELGLAYTSAAE
jgi:hypothetical protein